MHDTAVISRFTYNETGYVSQHIRVFIAGVPAAHPAGGRGLCPRLNYVAPAGRVVLLSVAQIDIDDGAVFGDDEHLFDDVCLPGLHGHNAARLIGAAFEADMLRCNAKL